MSHERIDSAPRDGTPILIWQPSEDAWIAARWFVPSWGGQPYWQLVMAGECPEGRELVDDELIWMSMPAGPGA